MRYIYATILFSIGILALYLSTRMFYGRNYTKKHYIAFSLTALGSGMWSIGYALMYIFEAKARFLIVRGIGIFGLFLFLIAAQYMMIAIAEVPKLFNIIFIGMILTGVVVLILVLNPSSVSLMATDNGTVTVFNSQIISIVYTVYTLLVAVNFVVLSLLMIGNNKKRVKSFGKYFLIVEIIIIAGMVVDTILPAMGVNFNIPASTMVQFCGLEIIYYAVHKLDRNEINMGNLAGYIFNSLKTPILVMDAQNNVKVMNNEAKRLFALKGSLANRFFWKTIFNIDPPENLSEEYETRVIDAVFEKKNIHCKVYVDSIFNEYKDYIGYIVSVVDITEQVKNIQALEIAKRDAQQADQAKSLFLANMSHEIRTPMNSILGFSELALGDDVNDKAKDYFTDIRDSAETLLTIINDILDISKIESGKMELFEEDYSSSKLFREVSLLIEMQAEKKGLKYETDISSDIPNILHGDKGKIREILVNVLNNGIKYTDSGTVKLKANIVSDHGNMCRLKFRITDTGIGIREADIDNIFDKFKRVDLEINKSTEGTGLGLSISKGFLDLMGGKISVSSEYGKGTTFTIELEQQVVDSSPIAYNSVEEANINKTKHLYFRDLEVLAVDDNKVNLKVITKALKKYGLTIDTAPNGFDSVEMCKAKDYDLVLMDQMMPVMDGIEAMRQIRKFERGYEAGGARKIVALTANVIDGAKEDLIGLGFDGFIGKPINFPEMEKTLKRLLPSEKYYYEEE